jgi:ABC-type glutathione transport system ATPase component
MTVPAPQDYVLEMRGIKKHFTGVKALDGVDLRVRPGTVHVLVGENGAGKSTLMKVLSGEHSIDAGEIRFKGARLDSHGRTGGEGGCSNDQFLQGFHACLLIFGECHAGLDAVKWLKLH